MSARLSPSSFHASDHDHHVAQCALSRHGMLSFSYRTSESCVSLSVEGVPVSVCLALWLSDRSILIMGKLRLASWLVDTLVFRVSFHRSTKGWMTPSKMPSIRAISSSVSASWLSWYVLHAVGPNRHFNKRLVVCDTSRLCWRMLLRSGWRKPYTLRSSSTW